jgi:hypothetical protein
MWVSSLQADESGVALEVKPYGESAYEPAMLQRIDRNKFPTKNLTVPPFLLMIRWLVCRSLLVILKEPRRIIKGHRNMNFRPLANVVGLLVISIEAEIHRICISYDLHKFL